MGNSQERPTVENYVIKCSRLDHYKLAKIELHRDRFSGNFPNFFGYHFQKCYGTTGSEIISK